MTETNTSGDATGRALALPLLPLSTGVVLPQMVVTLALESPEARDAAAAARTDDGRVLLVPKVGAGYARVGTIARIENEGELPGGGQALVLRGLARGLVGAVVTRDDPAIWVTVDPVSDRSEPTGRVRDLMREYRAVVRGIAQKLGAPRFADALQGVDDAGTLADTAGWSPDLTIDQKVQLLEELDPEHRLELALQWARDALAELDLAEQIRTRVSEDVDKTQREFMLRRQLDAIRQELGELDGDGGGGGVDDFRSRLDAGDFPDAARAAIAREIDKLERTSEQSPEHGWIRTWLDTVFELPWGERSEERIDVVEAREILDADHTGLDDVKDRIVEYLAVRKLRAERGMTDAPGPPWRGRDPRARGPARRRQDVARRVGGARARALVRAHRPRWRARRGGAAGSPPHLRRIPARPHRAGADRGRHHEPRHRPRRGRQAGRGLAG
jgi:ATP-dependent Lon protease